MSLICYILLTIYIIWSIVIIRFAYKFVIKDSQFALIHPTEKEPLPEKYQCFARYDRKKWQMWQIYFGMVFLAPARTMLALIVVSIANLFSHLGLLGIKDNQVELGFVRRFLLWFVTLSARILVFCGGVFIKRKYVKIKDYDPTYPEEQYKNRKDQPPIIVSNHQTWIDSIVYTGSEWKPSFLCKKDVQSYPLFGRIVDGLQAIYVDRDNRDQKDQVYNLMHQRLSNIEKKKSFPQLIIFPEGTTSNGRGLLSFKRGAFELFKPLMICCLKYENKYCDFAFDSMGIASHFFLGICHFKTQLTFHIFDTFYPDHLNLKGEEDWKIYADKIKSIMGKCLNVPLTEFGFTQSKEYDTVVKEVKNKMREDRKNKQKQQ